MAKLARGLGPLQHNIALDSVIDEKESIGPLKNHENMRNSATGGQKKRARLDALIKRFVL